MMSDLDQIKKTLQSKYQIDCWLFLEDLENSPSSTLYKTLIPLYKESFEDSYRFVFFNFSPLQKETLDHVVKTIQYIDISPYFILVVTNQSDTVEYFSNLVEPIKTVFVNEQVNHSTKNTYTPVFNNSNSMCAHAWVGLHVDPDGSTRLCCEYQDWIKKSDGTKFNIRTDNIKDMLSSEYMVSVRNSFREGTTPVACSSCVRNETTGGESKRALTPYKLKNIYGNINWETDSVDENLGWIGGHLGNLCNLKCRICSPKFSSSIAVENLQNSGTLDKKNNPVYHTLVNNTWAGTSDQFWSSLRALVPQIKNFEFLGGEPLLLKENLEFMQWLIDEGHSHDCVFEFVTNGTQYPSILDSINKFKRFTLTFSIDNIDERFELERSGADWNVVKSNLQKVIALTKNTNSDINISITVNIQNILYLPELVNWLRSQKINSYYYNLLTYPACLSINQLTPKAKQMVIDKLNTAQLSDIDQKKLSFVIKQVEQAKTSDGTEFCQYMKEKDLMRNENFSRTHAEIASAMGYMLQ